MLSNQLRSNSKGSCSRSQVSSLSNQKHVLKECYGLGSGSNYASRKQASSLKKEIKLRGQYSSHLRQ